MGPYPVEPGVHSPAGASTTSKGVNFSVFSRNATHVDLLLFEDEDNPRPFQVIRLEAELHRTFFYWHVLVRNLPHGVAYAWRVAGPEGDTAHTGYRFDPAKLLLDPWAKVISEAHWQRTCACKPGDNSPCAMRALVTGEDRYDWEGDRPLNRSLRDSVIYEVHVGGFTRHPSSEVEQQAGTFRALADKAEYLQALGVTEVELMPVMAFDEQDVPPWTASLGLRNYWGYSPHSFFAPHPGYCSDAIDGDRRDEFRDMVKTLHRAGIGVILDVVLNHTAEGNEHGPVINFKGLGNETFYHLDAKDRRHYRDYTGCGNTINCNHPLVARFLLDILEYWVREMHVDGFRFDLASAMGRGEDGQPLYHAPILWNIEFSEALADTHIIAEAWDAGGLYQVGDFPGYRWAEWNGRYRDIIRSFVRGDKGLVGEVATRVCGSPDFYRDQGRFPTNSINFVTCHDGFTLHDLVSYNHKHNIANGEDNRDGMDDNLSWNCGEEGQTDDPKVLALRRRQARNIVAILLLSHGVPMLLHGDEVLRTQGGNNNGYCHDNETTWMDWGLLEHNRDMFEFVAWMIRFRKRHACLRRERFVNGSFLPEARLPDISWHGKRLNAPAWDDPEAQLLAYTLAAQTPDQPHLHIVYNMADRAVEVELPRLWGRAWYRALDTALPEKRGMVDTEQRRTPLRGRHYHAASRSVVVLESWANANQPGGRGVTRKRGRR